MSTAIENETPFATWRESATTSRQEAATRARQQEVVADLGLAAIVANSIQEVLDLAVQAAVDTLEVGFAKVLELEPGGRSFLLRAGRGWREGLVGVARIPVDASQGGYTLQADGPIVVEDLEVETRLPAPQLLVDHGVVAGMTVVIRTKSGPWGVFGVHSAEARRFGRDDVHFLQALANVITAVLERERVEEELRASRAKLAVRVAEEGLRRSERLASLGTLAAGIAHEINNPVNTILMTADSALLGLGTGRPGDRLGDDLAIIMAEAQRCGDIVERVLEFVRDHRPERRPEDLNEIVRAAVRLAETLVTPPIPVALDLDAGLPPASLNRAEMEQALVHLVRNALESGDGRAVAPTVRTWRLDGRAVITVEDDGVGIRPEVRDRIFDPFFTTRRDRGAKGLGLSLAHSIVIDHLGTIDVESEPDEGSTFRIEIPIAPSGDP